MRVALLFLFAITGATAKPEFTGELIFPLEQWHNHSSSIVELPNGDLLVCWFHGSGERTADDVLIQAARWNKTPGKWGAPSRWPTRPASPRRIQPCSSTRASACSFYGR